MKYVQGTSTHGIAHVFTGKSKTRRIFWAVLLLAAITYCLYVIITEILTFKAVPTVTTIFSEHVAALNFPAVTVCNVSPLMRSYLDRNNLTYTIKKAFELGTKGGPSLSQRCADYDEHSNLTLVEMQEHSAQDIDKFIIECNFLGEPCDLSKDFTPFHTQLGICYTFNGASTYPPRQVSGSGLTHSLKLILNINLDDYGPSLNDDVGVRVYLKGISEPPVLAGEGIAVSPGTNAFISLRQRNIYDQSDTGRCRHSTAPDMKLLQGYDFSLSACILDCLVTEIAKKCQCLDGSAWRQSSGPYSTLPDCHVSDFCCVVYSLTSATECSCDVACQYHKYEVHTSYSSYPAPVELQALAQRHNTTTEAIQSNVLGIHIYFEELIVYEEVTVRAQSTGSLLSAIGGLLGLFVGGSVITITEFVVWLLDELKDRCLGLSERNTKEQIGTISADLVQRIVSVREESPDPMELDNIMANRNTFIAAEKSTAL